MSRNHPKLMFLSVLVVVLLIPASSCSFSSLGKLMLTSIDWLMGPNDSKELQRPEPICSCAFVMGHCPVFVLHDAPEPYCPAYTRYCCKIEPLAALLLPHNVTGRGIWASRTALARSEKATRAIESCTCTKYLMPCPVQIYPENEFFDCPFFYRFCCDESVLRDAILPLVANPDQEPLAEGTQGQQKPQDVGKETAGDEEKQGTGSWWSVPSWIW